MNMSRSDYQTAYRAAHKDKTREYNLAYRDLHRDDLNAAEAARRARLKAAGVKRTRSENALYNSRQRGAPVVDRVDTDAVFARDKGLCGICSETVDPNQWQLDHIIPLNQGGVHSYANVRVAHPKCNQSLAYSARKRAAALEV